MMKLIRGLKRSMEVVQSLNAALFYLGSPYGSGFYHISKRLLGITHVSTAGDQGTDFAQSKDSSRMRLLGGVSLINVLVGASLQIWDEIIQKEEEERTVTAEEKRPDGDIAGKCPLCMNVRKSTSCTPCGHVFCWNCIHSCIGQRDRSRLECPVCRETFHPSRVVLMRNYR